MQETVLRAFANEAVFSKNRTCRILTRSACGKENLM